MNHSLKNALSFIFLLGTIAIALSSCYVGYEGRYYHHYHHHHREWYASHHRPEPAGVNWSADVDIR